MASGRPVIAYDRGGARDTVVQGKTGLLFKDQTVDALMAAVREFEDRQLWQVDADALVQHTRGFSEAAFAQGINDLLPSHLKADLGGPKAVQPDVA